MERTHNVIQRNMIRTGYADRTPEARTAETHAAARRSSTGRVRGGSAIVSVSDCTLPLLSESDGTSSANNGSISISISVIFVISLHFLRIFVETASNPLT